MSDVALLGQRVSQGASKLISGNDIILSHSAGASAMIDHGIADMNAGDFRLFEIKQSGILTFDQTQITTGILVDIWMCSGGMAGSAGSWGSSGYGGNGGHGGNWCRHTSLLNAVALVVAVAAAGGQTEISDAVGLFMYALYNSSPTYNRGAAAASGGLGGIYSGGSTTRTPTHGGDGVYPFDDAYFQRHCPGGGGGRAFIEASDGHGGDYGGGPGGESPTRSAYTGGPATNYGGGGGGGKAYNESYAGGVGYQGVIWLRVKV